MARMRTSTIFIIVSILISCGDFRELGVLVSPTASPGSATKSTAITQSSTRSLVYDRLDTTTRAPVVTEQPVIEDITKDLWVPPFEIPTGAIEMITDNEAFNPFPTSRTATKGLEMVSPDSPKTTTVSNKGDVDETTNKGITDGKDPDGITKDLWVPPYQIPVGAIEMITDNEAFNPFPTSRTATKGLEMVSPDSPKTTTVSNKGDVDETTNKGITDGKEPDGVTAVVVDTVTGLTDMVELPDTTQGLVTTERTMRTGTGPFSGVTDDDYVTEEESLTSYPATEKKSTVRSHHIPPGGMMVLSTSEVPASFPTTTTDSFTEVLSSCSVLEYQNLKHLLNDAFHGYDRRIRPRVNQSQFVFVASTFVPLKIIDFDTLRNNFTMLGYFKVQWRDDFLVWSPGDYGNTKQVRIPSKNVWLPRLSIKKSQSSTLSVGSMETDIVVLRYNGYIQWWPEGIYSVVCGVSIKYFPLDEQVCTFAYYVADEDITRVKLVLFNTIITSELSENAEWEIQSITSEVSMTNTSNVASFHFSIKRRAGFAMFTLLVPAFLLSALCCSAFLVPVESGEKATIAVNVFLACIIYVTLVTRTVPPNSSELSYFVLYVVHQLGISALLALYAIVQSYMYQQSSSGVHNWLSSFTNRVCQPKLRQRIDILAFIVSVVVVTSFMLSLLLVIK